MEWSGLDELGQVSRRVSDIDVSVAWFRDVLGLRHLYSFGPLAFFDCGGTRLYLAAQGTGTPGADSVLYFRVNDIEAGHAELVARGVTFVQPPTLIHRHEDGVEEWMAFFTDPDGGVLALMSQTDPAAG
jgi:methylmalonyl-CoA/ethylmalonyl-CoA epimerase